MVALVSSTIKPLNTFAQIRMHQILQDITSSKATAQHTTFHKTPTCKTPSTSSNQVEDS